MNVSEMSDGVKIALTILLICILIGIVFGIVRFVKGTTDEGTANLESSVLAMSETEFDQYDNTIRTGTQVTSLVQLYLNRDMAIFVATKKNTTGINYGRKLDSVAAPAADAVTGVMTSTAGGFVDPAEYNVNLTSLKNTAHVDFVRDTAKFDSYLIKDGGGQTVGVYFIQK